jgi:hypothetical protein
MPLKRIARRPLANIARRSDWPPVHLVVKASVLKVFFEPSPYKKTPIAADCDIAEIKKTVNVGAQQ